MRLCGLLPTRWQSCFSATVRPYSDISKESTMKELLHNTATRQKGVHLLNTLLQKAIKSGEDDTAEKINGLLEKQSGRLDIIGMCQRHDGGYVRHSARLA